MRQNARYPAPNSSRNTHEQTQSNVLNFGCYISKVSLIRFFMTLVFKTKAFIGHWCTEY